MITSVDEFVARVRTLKDPSDAYLLFELDCSEPVRASIYALGEESCEPFRAAMHELGFTEY